MVQIIEEHRKPSFMEGLAQLGMAGAAGAGQHLMQRENQRAQQMKTQQENTVLQKLTGIDFQSLQDPAMRQKALEIALQGQQKEQQFGRESGFKEQESVQRAMEAQELQKQKYAEARRLERLRQKGRPTKEEKPKDLAPYRSALKTLNEMRALRAKGNLGIGSTYSLRGETLRDTGKYSTLGKSLIQFATNIPIRNKAEFEVMAHDLYDPNLTDEKAAGILDAMEQIIMQGLSEGEGGQQQNISPVSEKSSSNQGERQSLEDIFG